MSSIRRTPSKTLSSPRLSRRKLYAAMLVASQFMASGQVFAAPEGGEVVGGEGTIVHNGMDTLIHQATERLAVDWQSFDVGSNERVEFIQPSSSSIALNRVLSNRGSEILGRIDSNGQVMLVNPNGVVFGKDSIINVGGMIAGGMHIDPASFINGDFTLNSVEGTDGKVINYGIINAATGGSVTLVGKQVQNEGLISAKLGAVNLVAGKAAVLTFDQAGMVGVKVTEAVLQNELGVDAAVINNGTINAEGGRVLLSASVSQDIFSAAVNNNGMDSASSVVVHEDGSFTLGGGADVVNTGDISTSVASGAAGQVVVVGNNVTSSGEISANTGAGSAGHIELHSRDTTKLTQNAQVSAQNTAQGKGGDIKILGKNVGVFDRAQVNASGANGGGQVLVGGDETGKNIQVRNADFIYVGENANIKTDALVNGNGGKLITFANDTARIYGNLSARGGIQGGNGGFIETSGLKGFEILNAPDAGAAFGKGGMWLIDPYDIIISDNTNNLGSGSIFTSSPLGSGVRASTIVTALGQSNVTVQTGNDGVETGKITVSEAINYSGTNERTLNLYAGNGIDIQADIGSSAAKLNVNFEADRDSTGGGSIDISAEIKTNGGDFAASGVSFDSSAGTIDTSSNTGGGDITITTTGTHATNDKINLGILLFKSDGSAPVRVSKISLTSATDVVFNNLLNIQRSGAITGEAASLVVDADDDIFIKEEIVDSIGGMFDAFNMEFNADADGSGSGSFVLTENKDIYTAGGNFIATGHTITLNGGTIDTDNSNSTDESTRSNGGNITLKSSTNIVLGNIVTDASCTTTSNCTGNLTISARAAENINVTQANNTSLEVAGDTTLNIGTGSATLTKTGNTFGKNLILTSANDASILDSDTNGLVLGKTGLNSNIKGNLVLTAGGNITQESALTVSGTTNLNLTGTTDKNIDLSHAQNDFTGLVTIQSTVNNLKLTDSNVLDLNKFTIAAIAGNDVILKATKLILRDGDIGTVGDLTITTNNRSINIDAPLELADNFTLNTGTGNITVTGTTNSDNATAKDLTLTGKDITFNGAVGGDKRLDAFTITSTGAIKFQDTQATPVAQNISSTTFEVVSGTSFLSGNINTSGGANAVGGSVTVKASVVVDIGGINTKGGVATAAGRNGGAVIVEGNAITLGEIDTSGSAAVAGAQGVAGAVGVTAKSTNAAITLKGNVITADGAGAGNVKATFTLANAGTITLDHTDFFSSDITLVGSTGSDTVRGLNVDSDWSVTGNYAGSITKNGAASKTIGFTNIEKVTGGTGADTFTINNANTDKLDNINGGAGDNTLVGRNAANTWTIDNENAGKLALTAGTVYVTSFSNIQNLTGGTAADTFDFSTDNASKITGKVSGGTGVGNTIKGRNVATTWTINGENAGTLSTTTPQTSYVNSFLNIQNLTGGTAADTFVFSTSNSKIGVIEGGTGSDNTLTARGPNGANTWAMTSTTSGGLSQSSTTYLTTFSAIQVLQGSGDDTMSYATANVANILNIKLGAAGVSGVTTFIGNGSDNTTLTGDNTVNTWTMTGVDAGTVGTIDFSNFKNLTGGNLADTFDFSAGSLTGILDGGNVNEGNKIIAKAGGNTWLMSSNEAGSLRDKAQTPATYIHEFKNIQVAQGSGIDTMSFAGASGPVNVKLGMAGVSGVIDFVGNGALSTLTGTNNATTWTINAANAGEVKEDNAVDGVTFSNFHNLTGGTGIDTFDFSAGGSIALAVNGGTGAANTLKGRNVASTWLITGANAGGIAGTAGSFSNIQNLTGGTEADIFNFSNSASAISGTVEGGSGADNQLIARTTSGATNTWLMESNGTSGKVRVTSPSTLYVNQFNNIQKLKGSGADILSFEGIATDDVSFKLSTVLDGFNSFVGNGKDNSTLNGENINNSWVINSDTAGAVNGITFSKFKILIGGNNNDTFDFSNASGITSLTVDGGTGEAGNIVNTLIGRNTANTWTISAANAGTLGSYAAFQHINRLNGGNLKDTFVINEAFAGDIYAGAGNDEFTINKAAGKLYGQADNDTFTFGVDGKATLIDGGSLVTENNILTGRNTATDWLLPTGNGNGTLTDVSVGSDQYAAFANIETLQGQAAVDRFTVARDFLGTVRGGAGNDIFTINAIVGNVYGEANDDEFKLGATGEASLISGGGGANILSGRNTANTWTISAENAGTLAVAGNGVNYVNSFTGIQTLNGGVGADTFTLNANITNAINAGNGNNIFQVNTAVNTLTGGADNDTFIIGALGSAQLINGMGGTANSITGRDVASTWTITGENAGTLSTTTPQTSYVNSFLNIQNLTGGTAADAFVFSTPDSKISVIAGGTGSDNTLTARGPNGANTWSMTSATSGGLSQSSTTYLTTFSAIQILKGSGNDTVDYTNAGSIIVRLGATGVSGATSFIGNSGETTLVGNDTVNTWTMTGVDAGTVGTIGFSNFKNLTGGNRADTFDFSAGSLTGILDGGNASEGNKIIARSGTDVSNTWLMSGNETGLLQDKTVTTDIYIKEFKNIQVFAGGGSDTVSYADINSANAVTVRLGNTGFTGVDTFIGNDGDLSTIKGSDNENTWSINTANAGTVTDGVYTIAFSKFRNLNGGTGVDTFDFTGGGSIDKVVSGGTGAANTLKGRNVASTWIIDGENTGGIAGTVNRFSNIQNLTGGTAADIFDFTGNNLGVISGKIDGGGANESNQIKARSTPNIWMMTTSESGSLLSLDGNIPTTYITAFEDIQVFQGNGDTMSFENSTREDLKVTLGAAGVNGVNHFIGNDKTLSTLVGSNTDNLWIIDNANAGKVNSITFAKFRNLTGGSLNDTFDFSTNNNGSITGVVSGGIDANTNVVNTLKGRNTANTWTITAADTGTLGSYAKFHNIDRLNGGNFKDTFLINEAFTGDIYAGDDNDEFAINKAAGKLYGEAGSDSFTLGAEGTAALLDGGSLVTENNILNGRDDATTWSLPGTGNGTLKDGLGNQYAAFTHIETLQGKSAADTFIIAREFLGTIRGGAGNDIFNINANVGNLYGEADNDSFTFGLSGSATLVSGGIDVQENNTLTGRNTANAWTITAVNTGKLAVTNAGDYVASFTDIQTLNGGIGADTFIIGANITNAINAGNGSNIFQVNTAVNSLMGGDDNDTFIMGAMGSAQLIDGAGGVANSLTGRDSDNTWTVTAKDAGTLAATGNALPYVNSFIKIQNLNGGSGMDTFTIQAEIGNLAGGDGNDSFLFDSLVNLGSAKNISGGLGINNLTGRNANNTWNITADNAGSLAVTLGTAYVNNFTQIQILNGGTQADTFDIGANIANAINAGAGNNIFKINTAVNNLLGGADNDEFIFGLNGSAGSIHGGDGSNTLVARNGNNTWNITAEDSGNVQEDGNFYVNNFVKIQNLHGGSGSDKFNINAAAGTLLGNDGDDQFMFNVSAAGTAFSIEGGDGSNRLVGRNIATTWSMTGVNAGAVNVTASAVYVTGFKEVQTLEGGTAADTLFAVNQNNDWSITGNNTGTLGAQGALSAGRTTFINMENLLGNQALDKFTFTTAQSYITGLIDGGSSATLSTTQDSINLAALTNGVTVELGNTVSSHLNLVNIESITASTANEDNNVIIGAGNRAYHWKIESTNKGAIEQASAPSLETSVNFDNFGDLRGGTDSDRFDLQASVSKSITGGDGADDLVDYSKRQEDFTIILGGDGALGVTGINGIEGIIGNSGVGDTYSSTLNVTDGNNTWTIGAFDEVTDGINDGTININGKRVSFENFNKLIGGSDKDTFNYSGLGQVIGTIDGAGGNNKINAAPSTRIQQFHVNGTTAGVTNIRGIAELTGNVATNSVLVSTASANIWNVNNQGIGQLNDALTFSGIANLTGGAFSDVFNVNNIAAFKGIIDGGNSTADVLNLTNLATNVSVGIGVTALADLRVTNIETLNANTNNTNTLIADNATDNTWLISSNNGGTLNTIAFSGFRNIAGREKTDTFTVNSQGTIGGWIDAGGGIDTLDLTQSNRDVTVRISTNNTIINSGEMTVGNIEVIHADAGNTNKLIARDEDNSWSITSANGGRLVNGSVPDGIAFTHFKHLTGGNQDDVFLFESAGSVAGFIDGADHRERDIVDVSKATNANIVITAPGAASGYNNIEKYVGNNITSVITGDNRANIWVVANNSGTLNGTIEFAQFANLRGGDQQDTFTLNNATLTGFIDGADGNDVFSISGSAIAGDILGGAGEDEFTITVASGFAGNAKLHGGSGTNRLNIAGGEAGTKATHQEGVFAYTGAANNTYTLTYAELSDIFDNVVAESLTVWGTATADIFRLQNNKYRLNNLSQINYAQKDNLVLNGSANDQMIVDGEVTVGKTITVNNASVVAENNGKLVANALDLNATQALGSAANRVQLAVNDLYLRSTNGDIYLTEQDALNIKQFSVSATEVFDLILGGDLTSDGGINYAGQFNVNSQRGGIALNQANSLSGPLNLKAAADIALKNLTSLNLAGVSAQNLTLETDGIVKAEGAMMVNGLTSISAASNISLLNTENDFNAIKIVRADNVALRDKNNLTLAGINASGNVTANTNGALNVGASCIDACTDSYGIKAASVNLDAGAGAITVGKNIAATQGISLLATGITANDALNAKQIVLNARSGNVLLNESGSLQGQAGDLIEVTANRIEQRTTIVGGGAINLTASDNIQMASNVSTQSTAGNVTYRGKNIALASIDATKGEVKLVASGAITDSNNSAINIRANRWVAEAIAGIGTGALGVEGQDAIETDVKILSLNNAGKLVGNSTINVLNKDAVTIEQLRNNGDISVANLSGDILLDKSRNTTYSPTQTDARLQGGVINTNTGALGGTLLLSITNGMVSGLGTGDKENPDIIANQAIFDYPDNTRFNFGDRRRPIVMHIPEVYKNDARTSSVKWYRKKPATIIDSSKALSELDSLISGSDQLIQIEGLNEIDPAIFTSVRNYVHDEVAILMPVDQRFEDDEYAE